MANQLPADVQAAVEAAVMAQAHTGESSRSIASRLGVHYQTIGNVRRRLEKQGLITRLRRGARVTAKGMRKVAAPPASMGPVEAAAAMLPTTPSGEILLEDTAILTPEQVLKRLSWMAVAPQVPFPVQVQAQKALYDIGEAERTRAALSSTEPKSEEEAVERLLTLRKIVGGKMWAAAEAAAREEENKWALEKELRELELNSAQGNSTSLPG